MIFDSLENGACYYSVAPRLRQAFEYVARTDLAALEPGRHAIDGDEIFVNIMECDLKNPEDAPLEVHDKYIDIQILLAGEAETMGWCERRACRQPRGEFDAERDILFYEDRPQTFFEVVPGQFVIFLPEDAHAPMIGRGRIKKAIVKVLR